MGTNLFVMPFSTTIKLNINQSIFLFVIKALAKTAYVLPYFDCAIQAAVSGFTRLQSLKFQCIMNVNMPCADFKGFYVTHSFWLLAAVAWGASIVMWWSLHFHTYTPPNSLIGTTAKVSQFLHKTHLKSWLSLIFPSFPWVFWWNFRRFSSFQDHALFCIIQFGGNFWIFIL